MGDVMEKLIAKREKEALGSLYNEIAHLKN